MLLEQLVANYNIYCIITNCYKRSQRDDITLSHSIFIHFIGILKKKLRYVSDVFFSVYNGTPIKFGKLELCYFTLPVVFCQLLFTYDDSFCRQSTNTSIRNQSSEISRFLSFTFPAVDDIKYNDAK